MDKSYWVYILASSRNGTLYIDATSNLAKRILEHREGVYKGFSKKYGVDKLVYCEHSNSIESAILREKQLKKWNRGWKLNLIEDENPTWRDVSEDFLGS